MELYPGAKPCVGCGFCCRKTPCGAALRVHGPVTKCPSLKYREGRYFCALCELPGDLGKGYRDELSVGAGCCCSLFNQDRENIPPPETDIISEKKLHPQCRALLRALGRGWFGGDALWLAINDAARDLGKQWMEEALYALREERPKHIEEFMG